MQNETSNLLQELEPALALALRKYTEAQTPDNWSALAGKVPMGSDGLTVWQAVLEIDPTFPAYGRTYDPVTFDVVSDWSRIPSAELVVQAVLYATR